MIPAVMHTPLAVGITLLVSFVSGIAVWGEERPSTIAAPPRAVTRAVVPRDANVFTELGTTLFTLGDPEQRARATVAATASAAVMMRAAAAPRDLGAQRGLPWASMNESQRAIGWWMLRVAGVDDTLLGSAELADVSFACAGEMASGGDAYVRLHGASFVVECVRHGGAADLAVRDFVRDASAPWLRDRVAK